MAMINFFVNGKFIEIPTIEGEMLSDLLRNRLGLLGTKIGCNEAECGACTVVIDGKAILSCNYPAQKVQGKHVLTIEGLACRENNESENLHPLQEAFIRYGAVQCGFCIPGQIMTSYALLKQIPNPNIEEIQYALKDTLCRCAGYPSIIAAIQAAAANAETVEPSNPPLIPPAQLEARLLVRCIYGQMPC